jgi:hypothetical protein
MSQGSTGLSSWEKSPITVTVQQFCKLTGLGLSTAWKLIKEGKVEVVRIPGVDRTLIKYPSVVALLGSGLQRRGPGRPRKVAQAMTRPQPEVVT